MKSFTYIGTELELFSEAKNWKNYLKKIIIPYLHGDVLEVGTGLGSNTVLFRECSYGKWLCLEPDSQFVQILKSSIELNRIPRCSATQGTINNLKDIERFDTILYMDVLEHIEDDYGEVKKAYKHLKVGGNLIIIGPAHQWLFTPFDESIGHYRRYTKASLKSLLSNYMEIVKLDYLDCVGLLASLGNKLILKQSKPTLKQIKTWDRLMVPISSKLDSFLGYRLGKSIILIIKKNHYEP
jgi:SAM-dependent methyltransferase